MARSLGFLSFGICLIVASLASAQNPEGPAIGDPRGRDSILDWNAIALKAVADDFSNIYGVPDQKGPTHTSRALAIVHLAMFDAANMVTPRAVPYLPKYCSNGILIVSIVKSGTAYNSTHLLKQSMMTSICHIFPSLVVSGPMESMFIL